MYLNQMPLFRVLDHSWLILMVGANINNSWLISIDDAHNVAESQGG